MAGAAPPGWPPGLHAPGMGAVLTIPHRYRRPLLRATAAALYAFPAAPRRPTWGRAWRCSGPRRLAVLRPAAWSAAGARAVRPPGLSHGRHFRGL